MIDKQTIPLEAVVNLLRIWMSFLNSDHIIHTPKSPQLSNSNLRLGRVGSSEMLDSGDALHHFLIRLHPHPGLPMGARAWGLWAPPAPPYRSSLSIKAGNRGSSRNQRWSPRWFVFLRTLLLALCMGSGYGCYRAGLWEPPGF